MPKRHTDLFGSIASFAALRVAAVTAAKCKRSKPGVAAFMVNLETRLFALERALQSGRWRSGAYTEMVVKSPKRRMVSAAPFRDRVVHTAAPTACTLGTSVRESRGRGPGSRWYRRRKETRRGGEGERVHQQVWGGSRVNFQDSARGDPL